MSTKYTLIIHKAYPQYIDICDMYILYSYDYNRNYARIDIDHEYLCVLKLSHYIERTPHLDAYCPYKTYLLDIVRL